LVKREVYEESTSGEGDTEKIEEFPIMEAQIPAVRTAVKLLLEAGRRMKQSPSAPNRVGPASSRSSTKRPAVSGSNASTSYSKQDDELYHLIGSSDFKNLTNAELWKRHRSARKAMERHSISMTPEAFRSRCNRIRRHHCFPPSDEVRKKTGQLD
jgi:hypothetical protein